jgi:asparagine synthetase B (glutamine-hydrolysing)
MPGLLGLKSLDKRPAEPEVFQAVIREVLTRGPFQLDSFAAPDGTFYAARAHQGIFNPAPQPVFSADRDLALFLSGEVYNEEFVAEDQPRSILKAYQREGAGLFARLNGSFALAIWEAKKQLLTLVVDRVASVPIYYTTHRNWFVFSPNLKPFLILPGFQPKVDPLGVENFLASGFMINGTTLLNGIRSLRPGEMLVAEEDRVRIERYWHFSFPAQRDLRDPREIEPEFSQVLRSAVRRQSRHLDAYAVTLSGGYDSRSILFYMNMENGARPLRTVTWGVDEKIPDSDAWIGRKLAEHLSTNHTFLTLRGEMLPDFLEDFVRYDEGRTDAVGNYPEGLRIFRQLRHDLGIRVLIRGNEIFGARGKVYREKDTMHTAFMDVLSCYPKSFRYLKPAVYRRLEEIGRQQMRALHDACPYEDPTDRKDYFFMTLRCSGYQSPLTQLKRQLIEERNPYLDNEVIDYVTRIPAPLKIWKNFFMQTVRNQIPGFTEVGFSRVVSLVDWDERFRSDLRLQNLTRRILLEKRNGFDEIIDTAKLRDFVERSFQPVRVNRKSLGRRILRRVRQRFDRYDLEFSLELFRLMILKIWADQFLKGDFKIE